MELPRLFGVSADGFPKRTRLRLSASCALMPRLKSSSIASRAASGPAGTRDLRFFFALPSELALITLTGRVRLLGDGHIMENLVNLVGALTIGEGLE